MIFQSTEKLGLRLPWVVCWLVMAPTITNADVVYDGANFNLYTVPDAIQQGLVEEKVYVNPASVGQGVHLTGSIGSNDGAVEAYWVSSDLYGLEGVGSGFATIKGGVDSDGVNQLIHDISFGIYNGTFEDVQFSVIPANQQQVDVIVTGYFADGTSEAASLQTVNGLEDWLALVDNVNNPFTLINVKSEAGIFVAGPSNDDLTDGGLTQTKQWEVSGVSIVPLPAAAWLFGTALLGMAGIGYRRSNNA